MAGQYKRQFGKEEREQRNLLHKEVKAIRSEIQQLSELYLHRELKEAQVVLGTPIGLRDKLIYDIDFDYFFLDEAAQCLEPLAWIGADLAEKIVLAGDPFQLPPTVLSEQAEKEGLSVSILEQAFSVKLNKHLLSIQYRMPPEIVGFSSQYFYENELHSFKEVSDVEDPLVFIDTAGADFAEIKEEDGSIHNDQELDVILKLLPEWKNAFSSISLISPYAGQVARAHKLFPDIRTSTIDSYQGQEDEMIILSLVRSNQNGTIGFLSDYRRMNVALTRAQRKLVVIGDSATLGNDDFYRQFLDYVEGINGYKSVFEFLY
jgi:superfamily I DNA and/or RNA helicase